MDVQTERVNAFVRKHKNQKKALIAILQDIQAEYNYLPREALQQVSRSLAVPLIDVIGVATFYRAFSLKPRGRHVITVCLGTACHVRGGPKILEEFERRLGVAAGDTTGDGEPKPWPASAAAPSGRSWSSTATITPRPRSARPRQSSNST